MKRAKDPLQARFGNAIGHTLRKIVASVHVFDAAALCDIPIIALSAHAMTGDAERALQSGCNDYLSKPLDEDLLFAKLAKFLGQE